MKTLKLIDNYFKLLREQTPEEQGANEDLSVEEMPETTEDVPEEQSPVIEPKQLPENEKYVIKILTHAFIFNPKLFDKSTQDVIYNNIKMIKNSVNVPITTTIDKIKNIINLDNSLKLESKTINLMSKYFNLIEAKDATDLQTNNSEEDITTDNITSPKLNLQEIFPLYKEIILNALGHVPTDEELMIVKPVVNEMGDADPEKIVETIQQLLRQATEDDTLKQNLGSI